jgi:hypothetical protein
MYRTLLSLASEMLTTKQGLIFRLTPDRVVAENQGMDKDTLKAKLEAVSLTDVHALVSDTVSYRTLQRMRAGTSPGTVAHHMAVLEALKRIKPKRKG